MFLAGQQTKGRGRGQNNWISSAGCIQFTLLYRIPSTTKCSIVFIQYLVAIAIVDAIKKEYNDLSIFIKWPNDIYHKSDEGVLSKLGGILINSHFINNEFTFFIGKRIS